MKGKVSKKRKRKLRGWTKAAIVVVSLLLVVSIVFGVGYGVYKSYYNKMNYEETLVKTEFGRCMRRVLEGDMRELMHAEHVYNVLLIGQDTRVSGENRYSDTIILVSINESTEKIIMTSIMRDSWVHIPGYGADRINMAYAIGGADLLIDTVETNFHIRIDNYVTIDFFAFIETVDALGGVEITISEEERLVLNDPYIFYMNQLLGHPEGQDYVEQSGTNTLNGVQTLCYARIRYLEGADFARTERQRKVINAVFEKFKDCSVAEMLEVAEVVLPNVTTDIDENTMLELLMNVTLKYKDYDVVSQRVPFDDTWNAWIHEMDGTKKEVLNIDIELNSQYLVNTIYVIDLTANEDQ